MQRHDPDVIRRVKKAAPLAQIVARHVDLSPDGSERQGRCRRPVPAVAGACAFRLNLGSGEWMCGSCAGKGDILDFVMLFDRVPFAQALHIVADAGGVRLPGAAPASGSLL
ncbi:CHC2 zinc finger domain-containing protein [Niveispirillum sp.]|uniref:CHC2 zinc finger domain-containing protein n=1 Tax=Niveispirillum sp. TaxID=1917217 RepID=UPI001B46E3F8|nr:CHC2 zinc finger domain-containing protein [Niveispirillum sp.]MBP7336888.1 hypothetical protein [Niveispirillum sp.]